MSKRVILAVLVVGVLLAVAVGVLFATGAVMVFRHGLVFTGSREVSLELEPDEFSQLETLPALQHVNVKGASFDQAVTWAHAHPEYTVTFEVELPPNVPFDRGSQVADLTSMSQEEALALARESLTYASNVKGVRIDASNWSSDSLVAFHELCPQIAFVGTYSKGSINVPLDATEIDIQLATTEDVESFAPFVGGMPNLKFVNVGEEQDGHTKLHAASLMRQSNPGVDVSYAFHAFGKRVDIHETTLDFRRCPMTDDGTEVRDIMNNMPWVTFLDLDTCGLDDETCAAIRNDYPNAEVVWRVWFGDGLYTVRTDEVRIFASAGDLGSLSPENDQALQYCNKVKYLDLGHNGALQDIWFVNYMPDLEVFICIQGNVSDLSPLANCPHLEFLEVFSNSVYDLSPLANCHELKHLNCCNNPGISDISCLYDIDLERFWCGYPNSVPQEQFDTYQYLHPNCTLRTVVSNPHEDYRDDNPRYLLLREQIGYDDLRYSFPENDPLWEGPIDIPEKQADSAEGVEDSYSEDEVY